LNWIDEHEVEAHFIVCALAKPYSLIMGVIVRAANTETVSRKYLDGMVEAYWGLVVEVPGVHASDGFSPPIASNNFR